MIKKYDSNRVVVVSTDNGVSTIDGVVLGGSEMSKYQAKTHADRKIDIEEFNKMIEEFGLEETLSKVDSLTNYEPV